MIPLSIFDLWISFKERFSNQILFSYIVKLFFLTEDDKNV